VTIPAEPAPSARPEPPAQHERAVNAGPPAEDEITEWLGAAAKPSTAFPVDDGSSPPGRSRPDSRRPAARSAVGRAARIVVVVSVVALLVGVAVRHFARSSTGGYPSAAAAAQAAAARDEAAAWVAQQVSRDAVVSCDKTMCAALTAHGFPSHDLLVLGPTSPDPVISAVVVETPAVQGLFGSSLATAWAPAVLASFGSGSTAITVRVIAPHGAAAYQTALDSDLADRRSAGAALLNDPQITVPTSASGQLTMGAVDSRLLLALAALARHQPIGIVQFGDVGSGASAGVPLRFADLTENGRAAHRSRATYVESVRAYLSTVNARFRPARMTTVVLADGQAVLRVEFTAPSPLGMFGTKSSS